MRQKEQAGLSRERDDGSGPTNQLAGEKSPYLLQHAANPVHWYPWGSEAFLRAVEEDKPVFLSIGYSTCHWCHVMAHESFENEAVAHLLNRSFINIKVDREERPDVDSIYMAVCQMMTGTGGWPLSIFLTPEKKPFFAATYIPRENRFGMTGMLFLLPRIIQFWKEHRQDLIVSSEEINARLAARLHTIGSDSVPDSGLLAAAYDELVLRFDPEYGGFGSGPKFPSPHTLMFLLRYWKRTGNTHALFMVTKTLDALRLGGIYDQIGGGFHRYATDMQWRFPHFEKMLYDQAWCAIAYIEAYQVTSNPCYRKTAEQILEYILRDLKSPEGAFCSAEDADSAGREGGFYLWSLADLQRVLGNEDAVVAHAVFHVTPEGNFVDPNGSPLGNVLYRTTGEEHLTGQLSVSCEELTSRIESIQNALFLARKGRPRPMRDDKVLADWNGFAIAALAKAAQVFGTPFYAEAAKCAADFILTSMRMPDGGVYHRYRDGEAAINGFAADYAAIIFGLTELYEATFEDHYLAEAVNLNRYLLTHFHDDANGGFFATSQYTEQLLVRIKDGYDGAVPSGNSLAFLNLLRFARFTGDSDFERKAQTVASGFGKAVREAPAAHTFFLCALDYATGPSAEVVIVGNLNNTSTKSLICACRSAFLPSLIIILKQEEQTGIISPIAQRMEPYRSSDGKPTAFVCINRTCSAPVTDSLAILHLLASEIRDMKKNPDMNTNEGHSGPCKKV